MKNSIVDQVANVYKRRNVIMNSCVLLTKNGNIKFPNFKVIPFCYCDDLSGACFQLLNHNARAVNLELWPSIEGGGNHTFIKMIPVFMGDQHGIGVRHKFGSIGSKSAWVNDEAAFALLQSDTGVRMFGNFHGDSPL